MLASLFQVSRRRSVLRRALALLTGILVATSIGGCGTSPRFQAPFTLANPNERHPIAVRQGEVTLDLAIYPGTLGLNQSQKNKLANYLQDYKSKSSERLLIRAPAGGPNERAARHAYDQVRTALRRAGIDPYGVAIEPYYGNGDPSAPLRLSYLQVVAVPPDCPDWSENIGRDPQNMPWPNMGCATQRNFAAMVANPEDLLHPRGETPRPGERRDVVWDKYVAGEVTGSKWGSEEKPISEHANVSDIGQSGGGQ
jgi:pilus assembly protein CpaD